MRSLQFRLGLGLLISLLLAFVALWILVSSASRYLAEDNIATRLQHDSETLLTALQIEPNGGIRLEPTRIDPIYKRPFSGHYFKILQPHNELRSRSLWDQDIEISAPPAGRQQRLYIQGPQQQPLLMIVSRFELSGQSLIIAVAEDLSPIESELAHFQQRFALAALLLLLILIAIQGFILRAGLRPLEKTRQELHALARGRIAHLNPEVPAEVSPLVSEINHLLDVLDKRLTRSRNALGDLAHALKKPLTVLKRLSSDKDLTTYPELQKDITVQLDNMQRQVTHILQRARLAGEGPVGSLFYATQEIPALIDTLHAMYRDKALQIESDYAANLCIAVDREDMLELIGNLLDNACKWARHKVRLSIQHNQDTHIDIEDDGPGVAADKLADLTRRGLRLDESTEGHGLGLAIVNEIIANLGGELQLRRSTELGGLRVSITLRH